MTRTRGISLRKRNPDAPYFAMMRAYEVGILRDALLLHNGDPSAVAEMFGVTAMFIRKRLFTLGIPYDKNKRAKRDEKPGNEHPATEGSRVDSDLAADDLAGETNRTDDLKTDARDRLD